MLQLSTSAGGLIRLKPRPARTFRGTRLPGSELFQADRSGYLISLHNYEQSTFRIMNGNLRFTSDTVIVTKEESSWLRMETVLTGKLHISEPDGRVVELLPGQYHITDTTLYQRHYPKENDCNFFSVYCSPELLSGTGLREPLAPIVPRPLPMAMQELIYEMLENPFDDRLRPFYYENRIRELLFLHMAAEPIARPGELTQQQITLMYEADRIMAGNLDGRVTLRQLAKMIGTNFVTLKKMYEQVFGIGIFPRMMQRRMERAKFLLEKTDKPLKDVCELAGYETLAGFITEFRKRFKITPNEWRKGRRGW